MLIDSTGSASELSRSINLLDAVYFIKHAWERVTPSTIRNCFRKAGLIHGNHNAVSDDDFTTEDDLPLSLLAEICRNEQVMGIECLNIEDFFEVDRNLLVEDTESDACLESQPVTDLEDADDEVVLPSAPPFKNYRDALDKTKELKEFLMYRGDHRGVEMVSNLELHLQDIIVDKCSRQSTLSEYFQPTRII